MPLVHTVHSEAPGLSEYVPIGHGMHDDAPAAAV